MVRRWGKVVGAALALALVGVTLVQPSPAGAIPQNGECTPKIHYMAQNCQITMYTSYGTGGASKVAGYADLSLRWDAAHTHINGSICIHDTLSNNAGIVVNLRALRASNPSGDLEINIGYWHDGASDCARAVAFTAPESILELTFKYGDSYSSCPLAGISPAPFYPYCSTHTLYMDPVADRMLDMAPFIGGGYVQGCTTGFAVDGLGDSRKYLVSAEHCGFGAYVYTARGTRVGTASSNFRRVDHDIALIETSNDGQGFGMIFDGPVIADNSIAFYKQVTGVRYLSAGDVGSLSLCTSGAKSGVHCGYVLNAIELPDVYDSRYNMHHSGLESATKPNDGQCVQTGDSGGPVFVTDGSLGVRAVGIISGLNETSQTCTVFFQDFRTITADFAVVPSTRTPIGGHDITSDGNVDVVAIRPSDGYLARWPGNGKGGFGYLQGDLGPGWGSYRDLAEGDINNDGRMDLLAIRSSDGLLGRWLGNGSGGFSYMGNDLGPGWGAYTNLVAGDINGDGKTDLMAIRTSDGYLARWSGNGSGGFSYMGNDLGPGWGAYTSLASGDINGDFKPDLLAIRSSDGHLARWYGNGSGGFSYSGDVGPYWGGYTNLVIGDFNADGRGDLVAVRPGGVLERWFGDGDGTFTYQSDVGQGWGSYRDLV